MGIDIAIVNERHEKEMEVLDPQQCLTSLAAGQWLNLKDSYCLQFIDPWGDTVFNQAQIPVLLAELKRSSQVQTDSGISAHLQKVCSLVERAKDEIHTYIKFIGD